MSRSRSDSATTGLGNSGYQSAGCPVRGDDQRPAGLGTFGDQFVEVVGLLGGELAHGEVVEDEHGGADEFGEAFGPGPVGVAAGEVGQDAAGLGEADLGAVADGEVAEGLGDVGFADADRAVEDDRLAGCAASAGRRGRGSAAAGSFGLAAKSNSSEGGLVWSKRARRSRRLMAWSRGGRSRRGRAPAGSRGGPVRRRGPGRGGRRGCRSMPDSFKVRRLSCRAVSTTLMVFSW